MNRIGVEQSLTDVKQALQEKGYDVVDLERMEDAANCECCVVTGLDQNVMGMTADVPGGAVIQAKGLTAEDVIHEVEERLEQQGS
ncbi:YkuS family protein [Salirhabdus salicampi]|uniref:YkuS family protein n=1 Tax=Salirhabdus salicampi TaxID=476102 RepID=UPI0020C53744|nr:YkuS family protein [Salirhabdus salicampi]MCP8616036.1 YkuS family protein [Salirhabdus salicampi]